MLAQRPDIARFGDGFGRWLGNGVGGIVRNSGAVIRANSEDEMISLRDFLDSRMGRQFADDVVGNMTGCNIDCETAITSAIRTWQDWRISRQIERDEGIPAGLPYLTGWVQHYAIAAAMAESD